MLDAAVRAAVPLALPVDRVGAIAERYKVDALLVTPRCIDCGYTCTEYCSGATCETGCVGTCLTMCRIESKYW